MSSDTNMSARLDALRQTWDVSRARDDEKHLLINNLFVYINELSENLADARSELLDKKDAIRVTRNRVETAEKKAQALLLEKARHVFVSVIIDGDCMPFKDELIKQGMEGGKKTASLLRQAVEEDLKAADPNMPHHLHIIIRVYANIKGLAKTYVEADLLPDSGTMLDFVRGFNMGDPMCDYVDAGNGKECSDEKVKANVRSFLADTHCRQVFFGGSADNGYARLLGAYLEDEASRSKIALVEGPPFAMELAMIKDRFRIASKFAFESVFRHDKLPHLIKRAAQPQPQPSTTAPSASQNSNSHAWASVAKISATGATMPTSPIKISSTPSPANKQDELLLNRYGQRVDSPLAPFPAQQLVELKKRKMCNNYHLLGYCVHGDSCVHEHGSNLSNREKEALRIIARQAPCRMGVDCRNPECISGHNCTRPNCDPERCWFSPEMHNVDQRVVKTVTI